ncbi:hypothetical protein BGZ63DRAFT_389373 [Mariannaea sp. PMI_226]|nr:hypothetical protein BGZ63DRAFT_389373 [Mariannaea sp. PMI_226]
MLTAIGISPLTCSTNTNTALNTANTANLNTAQVETGTDTATGDSAKNTGDSKATGTGKDSKSTTKKTHGPTHTTFGANDPAGSVAILTPKTTAQPTPLYKIGDFVTFGWNYTGLQGTPTAIDVLVSCSEVTETWTLTQNMSFATKVSYVWDTNKDGDVAHKPLGVQLYTLVIKDSDAAISDRADPGYLDTFSGLQFGLYTPQPYTPLSDWKCVGCNAGSNHSGTQAVGFALTMSIITIATFTWFVAGLGLH